LHLPSFPTRRSSDLAGPPETISFAIRGPIARADLPGLCDRVCALLEGTHREVVLCDVSGIAPDAVTVDGLARLQLAARQHGCQVDRKSTRLNSSHVS